MRVFIAIIFSLVISIAMFVLMQKMTSADSDAVKEQTKPIQLTYLRDKKDTNIERKKRIKPKEPIKKVEPKNLKFKAELNQKLNKNVKVKPLAVNTNIDISSVNALSGAQIAVGSNLFDANMLNALKRVNPRYPRRAKIRRQEGFVQLVFKIDASGFVSDVEIVDSNPKGVFDEASIKAIKRWRFKPSKDDVPGSFKNATITFNFRLAG
ncbi:hypothetical protein CP965_05490 [Halarcobacter mediterraneus]|uniref:TonB C-terminal domain-containing protein n=1 Tax=Halarcobacter mediterraneus TaxID=2023153 RepID=A0A4V1M1D2_9BACT|nr:energy transducer TonB [Halarcobacter mediterraneus]RXK13254.1 hypothetical protein CP965_05490 [Halarcobacter mediterraneus]